MEVEKDVEIAEQPEAAEEKETRPEQNKTFTQEEVDKIVEKRLIRERKKFANVLDGKDPREEEIEERERAVAIRELQADAKGLLAEKGLPMEALELLNYTSKELCKKSIEALDVVMKAAVTARMNVILRGDKPIKKAPRTEPEDDLREAFGL